MSYIPTNWQTGDVITAEKLNKLEGGVAGASEALPIYKITQTFSVPDDAPTIPQGYQYEASNGYALIDYETERVLSWQEVSALNPLGFLVEDDVHAAPVSVLKEDFFDEEQEYGCHSAMFTCVTGEGLYLSVGWNLSFYPEQA